MNKSGPVVSGEKKKAVSTEMDIIIAELDDLRFDFMDLYNDLMSNPGLQKELHQLQKELPAGSIKYITRAFNHDILSQYNFLWQQYSAMKALIVLGGYISAAEIDSIEHSACVGLAASDPAFKRLLFYPALQAIHVDQVDKYKRKLEDQSDQLRRQMSRLNNDYNDRAEDYYGNAYIVSGLLSLIVVGLPLLIVTAVLHVIDKIETLWKTAKIAAELKEVEIEKKLERNPHISYLHNSIIRNPANHIRQSFFFLAKWRHMKTMAEIEQVALIPEMRLAM